MTSTEKRPVHHGWHRHPGVRSANQLSIGERAADKLRNGMGSWPFVFGALVFLAIWMLINALQGDKAFDVYPFVLLNLVLSCLAALQGAILLIAAKRSDQVSSELAQHDYEADCRSRDIVTEMRAELAKLHEEHRKMNQLLLARLDAVDKPVATD
jgi:uncharacterized membrane protein